MFVVFDGSIHQMQTSIIYSVIASVLSSGSAHFVAGHLNYRAASRWWGLFGIAFPPLALAQAVFLLIMPVRKKFRF